LGGDDAGDAGAADELETARAGFVGDVEGGSVAVVLGGVEQGVGFCVDTSAIAVTRTDRLSPVRLRDSLTRALKAAGVARRDAVVPGGGNTSVGTDEH
jgi:hypothetical protein